MAALTTGTPLAAPALLVPYQGFNSYPIQQQQQQHLPFMWGSSSSGLPISCCWPQQQNSCFLPPMQATFRSNGYFPSTVAAVAGSYPSTSTTTMPTVGPVTFGQLPSDFFNLYRSGMSFPQSPSSTPQFHAAPAKPAYLSNNMLPDSSSCVSSFASIMRSAPLLPPTATSSRRIPPSSYVHPVNFVNNSSNSSVFRGSFPPPPPQQQQILEFSTSSSSSSPHLQYFFPQQQQNTTTFNTTVTRPSHEKFTTDGSLRGVAYAPGYFGGFAPGATFVKHGKGFIPSGKPVGYPSMF